MIYTLIINKKSYDLPKKTLDIVEAMDEVVQLDQNDKLTTRQKYEEILAFLNSLLGAKAVKEILGSEDITEMDLTDITLTFRKIVDAYNKPVRDYERSVGLADFNQLPIDKLVQLSELIKQAQSGD